MKHPSPRKYNRQNPAELQSCLRSQVAEIRPSLPALQWCTFLRSFSTVGQKSQPLTLISLTKPKMHHHKILTSQKKSFSTTRSMKARLTRLATGCYNFWMLCFSHVEGGHRSSSCTPGWSEMHRLLQGMQHGTGSQERLRYNSVPGGNFCDVGQDILSIPGLSFLIF